MGGGDEPAEPVKKTFLPSSTTNLCTICCSGLSVTFCLMFIDSLVNILALTSPPDDLLLDAIPPTV